MGSLDRVYSRLPVVLQHGAASAFGLYRLWLKTGPGFSSCAKGYRERASFSAAQWAAWQQRELASFLNLAATRCRTTSETWSASQKEAAAAGRLEELPLLCKDPVRETPRRLVRDDMRPLHASVYHTSGSSGTPVATYWTTREIRDARALREVRSANWAGVSFKMPRATFSGRLVVPDSASEGPYHRLNLAERQVYFSTFTSDVRPRPPTSRRCAATGSNGSRGTRYLIIC